MTRASILSAVSAALLIATPAMAQDGIEILISRAALREAGGNVEVDVRLLNASDTQKTVVLPDRVAATLTADDVAHAVWLERASSTPASLELAPGSFAKAAYRLASSSAGEILSVPAWNDQRIALEVAPPSTQATAQVAAQAPPLPAPPPADRTVGNAFLENLSAYEPIYAVYGPGTNSEARIQLSFKYQLFGSRAREEDHASLRDGLYFAYTQRMFWDLGAESSPFRNIDYQPELFYLSEPVAIAGKATVSGQIGLRHESNGRDGDASRSINSIYVAPMAAFPLSGGWRLTVAPRAWLFVGDRSDNPDIRRYRGNGSLFMEVGGDNGLRLSTSTRFNLSTGKGAVSADMSYPLRRILGGGPDFYLFGQSFYGYGENLLDYDRRTTRFRIGLAVVR